MGATGSREVQPLFCVPQKPGHLTGLIWGLGLVPAGCCKQVKDSRGSQSKGYAPAASRSLKAGAACSPGPRTQRQVLRCAPPGLASGRLEAAAVIASTIRACSSLTSVGAVLELYKAGGGPGTDPVVPTAPSARARDRERSPVLRRADTLRQPVSGSEHPP